MLKWITPILYFSFLFLLTAVAVAIEAMVRSIGIIGEYKGYIDLPTLLVFLATILVLGVPLFWLANFAISKLEKKDISRMPDHFRQSALFYLTLMGCAISWVVNGFGNRESDGYLMLWIGISITGVLTNYMYLRRKLERN